MSTNQELERICNVAGYPIYEWASKQLSVRSNQGSKTTRSDENLLYLANKGAWVRVVSSTNLESNLKKYFSDNLQIPLATEESLAENFILYGGTSTYSGDLQQTSTQGMNLRSGLQSYNLIGQREINDYGYRPIPGITSVVIDTTGRMGSLRQATINFKVWDKYQLDIMDALYFRLGFTLLIEWGHAKYYDNNNTLQSSEKFMINPFNKSLTKESINIAIATNIRNSYGNYGGMLGSVSSFNFTMTQDGGYDCTVKALSLGAVMGNYAINHTSTLSNVYYEQIKQYLDTERSKAEKEAYALAQEEQDKAVQEAKDALKYSKDEWAKLEISDPLSNLLFNTKNIDGISTYVNDSAKYEPKPSEFSGEITYTPALSSKIEIAPKLTAQANKDKVLSDVSSYEVSHDISELKSVEIHKNESTSNPETFRNKNYYIEQSDKSDNGVVVFYNKDYHNAGDKEFYIKANSGILVKFDVDKLNQIFLNRNPGEFNILQPPVGNLTQGLTPRYKSNTAFGIVENLKSFISDRVAYTYELSGLKFVDDKSSKSVFTISYNYEDKQNAAKIFNDPNSIYAVEEIKDLGKTANRRNFQFSISLRSVKDDSCLITIGPKILLSGEAVSDYYNFPDLSLIKFFSGDQSLMTNSVLSKYNNAVLEAQKTAANVVSNKVLEISNDYNAEALRATIDSESTIELMLRSLLLYGVNNATNPQLLRGDSYKKFIQNLFSEGAYSKIFKAGTPGKPDYSKYTDEFFQKYIDGTLNSDERLEANFRYGNNYYLMSGENAYKEGPNGKTVLKNLLDKTCVPQVNFEDLFKVLVVSFGEAADLEVNKKPNISVYINLGMFLLMLNHTGVLYNNESKESSNTMIPMTYIDFNPETNYYLSSVNQFSIDPYKFLVPYSGTTNDYKKLFDKNVLDNTGFIKAVKPQIQDPNIKTVEPSPTKLFNFESEDNLSGAISPQKKNLGGSGQSGYTGRLMNIMVDINYLLEEVIANLRSSSDTNEVYFQSAIEKILADLNKSMGNYNAFRLSYNDNSNCYIIKDDQIQMRPDQQVSTAHEHIVKNGSAYQIPIFGKESIARSFEIRTDISSRLASMVAIASNPGIPDQVGNSKNTSDFGVYNTGSFDRYIPRKTTSTDNSDASNVPAVELATNFNNVVKSIYTHTPQDPKQPTGTRYISQDSVSRARSYYIDKMAKVKNSQPESVHAMIIPVKSNITMDGMSALYPFQLYTVDERVLPYRYNSSNLSKAPEDLRRVAFSISKVTHTLSENQWTTSFDGFMSLLRNQSKEEIEIRDLKPTTVQLKESEIFGTPDNINLPMNSNVVFNFFRKNGFTQEQASGFVGNFWLESGLNPNRSQKSGVTPLTPGVGYGLAQWTVADRQNKLKAFALERAASVSDLNTQLEFVIKELKEDFSDALVKIKTAKTVKEATEIIMKNYEKPGKEAFEMRLAAANKIYENNTATL